MFKKQPPAGSQQETKEESEQCCIGCKRPLTEFEFEYYENRRHLDRLCKSCVLEERAR
jgi:hypothetical protein